MFGKPIAFSAKFALTLFASLAAYFLLATPAYASEERALVMSLSPDDPRAILCLVIFFISYIFVMTEEQTDLRKSKPVILGAGLIWLIIGIVAPDYNVSHEQLEEAILHDLDEYGTLALFLFAAMTYINALESANVFGALRSWLVKRGFSYKQLFWVTGTIAFFLSSFADNLTTALVLGAVVMAVGANNDKFVAIAMVSIVCAANAGGAFSPFGDITTLMVWQSGHVEFLEFFALFVPAMAVYFVPALIMSFFIPQGSPPAYDEVVAMRKGAKRSIALFIFTIIMAICYEQLLGIPPFMGMMTGLSLLMIHFYFLRKKAKEKHEHEVFNSIKLVEWDTLLFFFGVMFSVGGLAFLGYLELASNKLYGELGFSAANITLGVISAIIDNIPVMFAVLTMQPDMSHFQWLLITLTCGVGGSLLSIGSAAGVALMGTSQGKYSFSSHIKWSPVVAIGYAAGIATHFWVNG